MQNIKELFDRRYTVCDPKWRHPHLRHPMFLDDDDDDDDEDDDDDGDDDDDDDDGDGDDDDDDDDDDVHFVPHQHA